MNFVALPAFFAAMTPLHWLGLGLALLVGELVTGTTFLLWPAVAAAFVAALAWGLGISGVAQWSAFAIATIALTLIGRIWFKGAWLAPAGDPRLNDRAAQMIGQPAVAAVDFAHGQGRIRFGDTEWAARGPDDIRAGDDLVVAAVEGIVVTVRRMG